MELTKDQQTIKQITEDFFLQDVESPIFQSHGDELDRIEEEYWFYIKFFDFENFRAYARMLTKHFNEVYTCYDINFKNGRPILCLKIIIPKN